jgi:4-amino-4-deoxy-L-arabinose transferase-like glycosyltransferase
MKRLSLVLFLVLLLLPAALWAAMSDSSAMTKAQSIWGAKAMTGEMRKAGDNYWTKQVGYSDDAGNFVVIGSGSNTWEDAFANVPVAYTPPVPHTLTAVARDFAGNVTESAPVTIYVCNLPCVQGTIPRLPHLVGVPLFPAIAKPLPALKRGR